MITNRKGLDLFLAALILRNSNNKILFQETTFQLKFKYDLWGQMRSKINQQSLFVEVKGRVKQISVLTTSEWLILFISNPKIKIFPI